MRFTDRFGAARWWTALAATLLGVAMVQAAVPATATADAARYLNLQQCVSIVRTPLDSYTSVLRTNVSNLPQTAVNCPTSEGEFPVPQQSGVAALDLTAGRYLNLHQCAYYSLTYHEWFTTILPSSAGTNISNVPETEANCPASSWQDGRLIPQHSGVLALDLTAGRYLNLGQCVYRTAEPDLFTTMLPWIIAGTGGGTNISNSPDTVVNCRSAGEGSASLPSLSGVLALDLRAPDSAGIVPDVVGWSRSRAITALQAAGFVAKTELGSIDCGPPYVQAQSPVGGTTAPLGSTVHIDINRQPRPGNCP